MKSKAGRPLTRLFASIMSFLLLTSLMSLTACLNEGSGSEDSTQIVADPAPVPDPLDPLTPPERTVCDPFDAGSSAQDRGLVGHLLYLTDDQPRYSSVNDYIEHGTPIQSTLYFDKIFIPTRAFDLGFYTQDGTLVLNQNDEPIYEYFALRLESKLKLAPHEPAGWYQMALLSDDGSILSEKDQNGQLIEIVNNDGNHPTRMGCGSRSIYMDHNTEKSVVLAYHQGPRYHIAMSVLWRPLPEGVLPEDPVSDIECGRSGNSRYFDSTQVPSVPQLPYYELLERGWKPLENTNYMFPEQALNPCAAQDPLLLTNFRIVQITPTQVRVSWTTSLPSTSQVRVNQVSNGNIILSPVDSTLKTSHSVTVPGLIANTLYSVRGISSSPDGQITESSESAFRTPR